MDRPRRVDETESPHARPAPSRGRSASEYDAVHDIREGRPDELGGSALDEDASAWVAGESEAARQERLAVSPEAAEEEAAAEAGPESARREALESSPERQADEADRLLERRPRSQDDRPVGAKEE